MLVLVSLDPRHPREGTLDLDLAPFGRRADATLDVVDVLSGRRLSIRPGDRITLDPAQASAMLLVPADRAGDSLR